MNPLNDPRSVELKKREDQLLKSNVTKMKSRLNAHGFVDKQVYKVSK